MKKSVPDIVADVLIYIFLGVLTIVCLIPFLHVASMSVSSNAAVTANQVFLLPKGLNVDAYKQVFGDSSMMHSLLITVIVTVIFTALGMLLTICGAYALSRKRLKGRSSI